MNNQQEIDNDRNIQDELAAERVRNQAEDNRRRLDADEGPPPLIPTSYDEVLPAKYSRIAERLGF